MTNSFLSKIRTGLKTIDRPWFYPIILLFVGLVTYGIIFTRPGFYWDDWGKVYLYYTHNPAVSLHYSPSRPFTVWPYLFLFTFAKMTPLVWQFLELIVRWLGIFFIYYTLNAIWPNRVWQNRWVGVLMFVFPGFSKHAGFCGLQRSTHSLFIVCFFTFSDSSGHKKPEVILVVDANVCSAGCPTDVHDGIFRTPGSYSPPYHWFTLRSQQEEKKNALRKTLIYWLPFVLGLVVFLWFRLFYIPSVHPSNPNSVDLLKTILRSPITGMKTFIGMAYRIPCVY